MTIRASTLHQREFTSWTAALWRGDLANSRTSLIALRVFLLISFVFVALADTVRMIRHSFGVGNGKPFWERRHVQFPNELPTKMGKPIENSEEPSTSIELTTLNLHTLNPDPIVETFYEAICAKYRQSYSIIYLDGKKAIAFLRRIFDETLQECTNTTTFLIFTTVFENKISEKSIHREWISREIFTDLIIQDKEDISLPYERDPGYIALKNIYNDRSWKEGTEKELILKEISDEEMPKIRTTLDAVLSDRVFQDGLVEYFSNLSPLQNYY